MRIGREASSRGCTRNDYDESVFERSSLLVRAFRRDPVTALEHARLYFSANPAPLERRRFDRTIGHGEALAQIVRSFGPFDTGPAAEALRTSVRAASTDDRVERRAEQMAGDPSLGELAYACVRALGPAVVVETGCRYGCHQRLGPGCTRGQWTR